MARSLHKSRRLGALYTDLWADPFTRGLARFVSNRKIHSLAARFHPELANAEIKSWNCRALLEETRMRRNGAESVYDSFIQVGRNFSTRVVETLKRRSDAGPGAVFFSYDTGALESMQWCRERGLKCILNQMDPSRVEVDLVHEEEKRWRGWSAVGASVPETYFSRREQEWALADVVMVNSEFCRQALVRQGVPEAKLAVVPLCYEASGGDAADPRPQQLNVPFRVLFLGQVILRKGIQYLIQAAQLLKGENVHFDVVGPVGISDAAVASAPANLTFHGRTSRDSAAEWYRQSDLFVLPTLSDGFAITQLEAMSYGLPVVATPCCGAVVTDAVDGFIVPPRDAAALANAIQRYLAEPGLIRQQRVAAAAKVKQFTLDHLAENLRLLERRLS